MFEGFDAGHFLCKAPVVCLWQTEATRSLEPLESVEVYNSRVDHVEHFGVYGDH